MDGDRLIVVKATREQDPAYRATLLSISFHGSRDNPRSPGITTPTLINLNLPLQLSDV